MTIAGIVLVALGAKKTIADVDEPLKTVPAGALCVGVALYLLGQIAFRLRNIGTLNRQRLVVAAIAIALIPVASRWTRSSRSGDRGTHRIADRLRGDPLSGGAAARACGGPPRLASTARWAA